MGILYLMKRWILKVERQHRLRLSQEIVECVSWLLTAEGAITAAAHIGEHGQICVPPPKSRIQKRFVSLEKNLAAVGDSEGLSKELLALGRYIADAVNLTFSKERNRVTVVLPEELRSLKYAPEAGQMAVVFVFKNIVEIWSGEIWRDHLRSIHADLDKLIEDSSEDLGITND